MTRKEPDLGLLQNAPRTPYASFRPSQSGIFHDFASAGVSEPILRVERKWLQDSMLEAVPQDRFLRPFRIEHQNIVGYPALVESTSELSRVQASQKNPSDIVDMPSERKFGITGPLLTRRPPAQKIRADADSWCSSCRPCPRP